VADPVTIGGLQVLGLDDVIGHKVVALVLLTGLQAASAACTALR
jgi:hypothetical protein